MGLPCPVAGLADPARVACRVPVAPCGQLAPHAAPTPAMPVPLARIVGRHACPDTLRRAGVPTKTLFVLAFTLTATVPSCRLAGTRPSPRPTVLINLTFGGGLSAGRLRRRTPAVVKVSRPVAVCDTCPRRADVPFDHAVLVQGVAEVESPGRPVDAPCRPETAAAAKRLARIGTNSAYDACPALDLFGTRLCTTRPSYPPPVPGRTIRRRT